MHLSSQLQVKAEGCEVLEQAKEWIRTCEPRFLIFKASGAVSWAMIQAYQSKHADNDQERHFSNICGSSNPPI